MAVGSPQTEVLRMEHITKKFGSLMSARVKYIPFWERTVREKVRL